MRKIYAAGTGALALLLTMTAAPASVRADSIYNNFGPAESFNEDYGYQIQAESFGFSTLAAAAFTPRGNFTLSEIDIGLAWSAHRSNAARIKLVNSVDGLPGSTVLESWSTAPAPCLQGPCGPQSLMSPGDVMLVSGTQYWVVAEPGNNGFDIWDWNNTGSGSLFATSRNDGSPWFKGAGLTPAFDVLGTLNPTPSATTPEPSSVLLIGAGLLALAGVMKRKLI